MKQLVVLSGKGGTGKTTVASALIQFLNARAIADCDVDAPNLHLLTAQRGDAQRRDYYGMPKARISIEKCIQCGACAEHCRFGAISRTPRGYEVGAFSCEGCGVCERICPGAAIEMVPAVGGETQLYTGERVFSTAQLHMGSGASGKLVTQVKRRLTEQADAPLAVIDGSPGIGCPVIATLSGASLVLIVTEPTVSGISDMARILKTAEQFGVRCAVCVNRYDINPEKTAEIERFCTERGVAFAGRIPYDTKAVEAINRGMSIAEIDCAAGRAAQGIYAFIVRMMTGG